MWFDWGLWRVYTPECGVEAVLGFLQLHLDLFLIVATS